MESIEKIDGSNSIAAKNGFTENINIHLHEAAVKYKDRPAAWDSRGFITYDQLDRYSNAVCNLLLAEKEKTGSGNICIMTEARSERLCFIMGILKAGMTYIPLDTKAPSERNIHIAENVRAAYILSDDDNYYSALEIAKHSTKSISVKALGNDRLSEMDDSYTEIRAGLGRIAYIIHTSGSTGRPKGVKISDRALNNFCLFMTHELTNITPEDRTCAIQNVSFDASIMDMFPYMLSGACIYFVPENIKIDISKLNDFMIENGITIQMMTTALYNMFVEYDNPVLKKLFVGGEKMTRFTAGTYELYNLYGPTEAAVAVTYHKVTEQSDNIPIGVPIANTKVLIVRGDGSIADTGEKGEMCIMGESLADGYINNEEETKKRFVPSVADPSVLMYRTGDIGAWTEDGLLLCFGRTDHQIKHRGYRIELDEINSNIAALRNISDSIVIYDDRRENKYIACFYCTDDGNEISPDSFRSLLEERLPEYMMPAKWVHMDSLPLNSSAKVDRNVLFDILEREYIGNSSVQSYDNVESSIRSIWSELLGIGSDFDGDATFRSLGGHSIMSFLALKRINEQTGADVDFTEFMEENTLNKLCTLIRSKRRPEYDNVESSIRSIWSELLGIGSDFDGDATFRSLGGHSIMSFLALKRINEQTGADVDFTEFMEENTLNRLCTLIRSKKVPQKKAHSAEIRTDPENRYEPFELNPIQQSYYYGRMSRRLGNTPTAVYLEFREEKLDVPRLEDALNSLVQRHEMLRCVICSENEQRIIESPPRIRVDCKDMTYVPEGSRADIIDGIYDEMFSDFVDLKAFPAFKFRVIRFSDDDYRILTVIDCTFVDGVSLGILIHDICSLYRGESLAPVSISFRDYLAAFSSEDDNYKESMKYWLDRADTLPDAPPIPVISENGSGKRCDTVRKEAFIPAETWSRLKKLAADNNLSLFVVQITLFSIVMARWSGKDHFTLNIPIFNRFLYDEQVMKLVGEFGSLIFLEVELDENIGFIGNCQKIKKQFDNDMEHRTINGIELIREYRERGRDLDIPIVFTSLTTPGGKDGIYSDETELLRWRSHSSQVWMDSIVSDKNGGIEIAWDCCGGVFDDVLLDDMLAAFAGSFEKAANDSCFLEKSIRNSVNGRNYRAVLEANRTQYGYDKSSELLHAGFMEHLETAPDSIACVTKNRSFSYSELYRITAATAVELRKAGMKKGDRAAIVMKKGWKQAAAALGILMLGGTYVPVSPEWPEERAAKVFAGADIRFAVTDGRYFNSIACGRVGVDEKNSSIDCGFKAETDISADSPAYIIYTSGSTGDPKGVVISHAAAVNTIMTVNRRNSVTSADRSIMLSELYFDLSVYDIFGMFYCGGSVYVPDSEEKYSPLCWRDILTEKRITLWNTVPALMQMFTDINDTERIEGSAVRNVFLSGDWIPLNLPEKIEKTLGRVNLVSMGGATEASIWSNYYNVEKTEDGWRSIPYGYPLDNQQMFVLNDKMQICPESVPGDIYIGGKGLAIGYLGDDKLTAEKFHFCDELDMRLYNTGDRGMYINGNIIEFLGRSDAQVKLNGFRIELGEIEAQALKLSGIHSAIADLNSDRNGINLYYTAGRDISGNEMKLHLEKAVPEYMLPSGYMQMTELPTTANGKIDRKKLPQLISSGQQTAGREADTETEKALAEIFSRVLERENVFVDENFFSSGGDSLKAIRLIADINKKFRCRVDLGDIFSAPVLKELAERIDEVLADDAADTGDTDNNEEKLYRLTPVQKLLYISSLTGQRTYFSELTGYVHICSEVDAGLMKKAVSMAVNRHSVLNFMFGLDETGEPYQRPATERADMDRIFLQEETDSFESSIAALSETQLALSEGEVCRFVLMHRNGTDNEYCLCAVIHHIAADEQSFMMIFSEIMSYYDELCRNKSFIPSEAEDDGYGRYLTEKERSFDKADDGYWEKIISDGFAFEEPALPEADALAGDKGVTARLDVDSVLVDDYEKICKENGVTLFTGILSAVFISLYAVTGKKAITAIVPFTDRIDFSGEQPFGMFIDDMLIYVELESDDTFEDVLKKVMQSFMASYKAGSSSMYRALRKNGLEGKYYTNRLRLPFFDLVKADRSVIKSDMLDISQFRYYINRDVAERDLSYLVEYVDGKYEIDLSYKFSAVSERSAKQLGDSLKAVMKNAVDKKQFAVSELLD